MNITNKKNKGSLYTAVTSFVLMLINGVLGLLMTQEIIKLLGSDANGLSATANQLISVLLLLEGGLTLAINVYLFKPFGQLNYQVINKILSGAKKVFNRVGLIFFLGGILLSSIYAIIVKSSFEYPIIFIVFFLSIMSTTINLSFATKYRILLQVDNKEYILNFISIVLSLIFMTLTIMTTRYYPNIIYVRLLVFTNSLINYIMIALIAKRKYKFIDFTLDPDYSFKVESKNVLYQNITSAFYSSFPIIYITATSGTMYTSLYAVYNNIFLIIKSAIYAFANAPRMALGQLIALNDKDKIRNYFYKYEFITINIMTIILLPTIILILPFIEIYTRSLNDIDYSNINIALLFSFTLFFEIIHIPSGNLINMSGNFQIAKHFQIISTIFLILTMILLNIFFGVIGVMFSVLFTAVILSIMEISYVYKIYFYEKIGSFIRRYLLHFFLIIGASFVSVMVKFNIGNYIEFIISGMITLAISMILVLLLNVLTNLKIMREFIN